MIKVVLIDDEELLRSGLALVLEGAADINVVGQASNGRDGVELVTRTSPDVVLMDIRMPVMDGIEATSRLASMSSARDIPVVMLTAFDTEEFILSALRAGAVGFLLKTTGPEPLVAAVRAAAAGQQILSPEVLSSLVQISGQPEGAAAPEPDSGRGPENGALRPRYLAELSERENEVAGLVAQGFSNQEIANTLFISLTTVKTHLKHILSKIDGTNRVHIAIAVLEGRGSSQT